MKYQDALNEIKATLINANEHNDSSPLFLLAGAGISIPCIPLASVIRKDLEQKARSLGFNGLGPSDDAEAYSFWFEKAFPSAVERAKYLRDIMQGKPVAPGSFNMAKLLSWEENGRPYIDIALTTNFDDFIDKALSALGVCHYAHAHPIALDQVDLSSSSERQIVHLHGTFKFYNCRNTTQEITITDERRFPEDMAVQNFLTRLMPYKMPIVVGYGGWHGDVFMRAMDRVLSQRQLPRNAYWFCYSQSDVERLPDKWKDHPAFKLVEPQEPPRDAASIFDDISDTLPSSSFKPDGGALSMMYSLLNSEKQSDGVTRREDVYSRLFDGLQGSGNVTQVTTVGPPWTYFGLLIMSNFHRDAWNAILAFNLSPKTEFHAFTLLTALAGISNALSHDVYLMKRLEEMSKALVFSSEEVATAAERFRGMISENMRRASSRNSEASDALEFDCRECGSRIRLLPEDFRASSGYAADVTCLECSALHSLSAETININLVERGQELEYIKQKIGKLGCG